MTTQVSGQSRRLAVSLSANNTDPVEQLDAAVGIVYQINRTLPQTALNREELIALAGLLAQVSGALATFTDMISSPVQRYDRTRRLEGNRDATRADRLPAATSVLRDGFVAAQAAARGFHADLRKCPY